MGRFEARVTFGIWYKLITNIIITIITLIDSLIGDFNLGQQEGRGWATEHWRYGDPWMNLEMVC